MSRKKIIIPSIFIVLILALFLIFGGGTKTSGVLFEAHQLNSILP